MQEVVSVIEDERPKIPVGLLSRQEKDRHIERAFVGLYRWYVDRSQKTRDWNPDRSFDWKSFRTDHSPEINTILEGFFAVEQYVPDYVSTLLRVIRQSHGRSHFHIRWGSEEEKHADLWYNTVLFSRYRSPDWLREYMHALRSESWELPWDDPLHMIFYTVFQELATQLNYRKLMYIAAGKSDKPHFADARDPVLRQVCAVISADESAHFDFFLQGGRIFLYYYPDESLRAIKDVIEHFAMPANDIIPDYDIFFETILKAGIYGPRDHAKDVVKFALNRMGVEGRKHLEEGIRRMRQVPDEHGNFRETAIFDGLDFPKVEKGVRDSFAAIEAYEREVGLDAVDPTAFVSNYK
ncbi:MAG: acyl-ACP desaturase [Armatimonadetes bacterium]|nr:acyl-ACP desaturase [Armatimonadota bacterium]